MCQFLDVVYQAIQLPLPIDLFFSSEREAVELFVVAQVTEDGFHCGEAPAVPDAAFRAVYAPLHLVGMTLVLSLAKEEGDLPYLGLVRSQQAPLNIEKKWSISN